MSCTPLAPRLTVPHEAEAPAEPRYGLFSAATIVEDMPAHAHHGVQYTTACHPEVHTYPLTDCPPGAAPANPTKTGERTRATTVADPFAVYAAETCFPGGDDETAARTNLRRRILRGERHTVEAAVDSGRAGALPYLRHPDTPIITPGTGYDLQTAVGLLEQTLAENGRTGIIHIPRWLAAPADELGIVHRDGPRARTFLGTAVAFGSGYSGRPPEGTGDDPAVVWLYATPHITIRRSVIVEPASWSEGAFNPQTNTPFLLAERVYVVDWPCQAWAVATTRPRVYTAPAPADPNPRLDIIPTAGEIPLEVSATVANWGNGPVTIDWGDGTAPVNVDDGATATHTYTSAGSYAATATSQADPEATTTTTVTARAPVAPPTGVSAAASSTTAAEAAWSWTQGAGPAATAFEVRHRPDGGTWSTPVTYGADVRTAALDGLTPATGYQVGVTTLAAGGRRSTEATATFTTPGPINPPVVTTGTPTTTTIPTTWTWTQGDGEPATEFRVRHRATGGTWSAYTELPASARNHTATGLAPATTYEVQVQALGATTQASDTVQAATPAPALELTVGATPQTEVFAAVADNHNQGPVNLTWGDNTPAETNPGDGTTATTHTYAASGTYTITATDTDDPSRTDSAQVNAVVPPAALALTAPATGTVNTQLNVQVNNDNQGPVTISWGDDTADSPNPGDGTDEPHTYAEAGEFTVTATDDATPSRSDTTTITITAA